MFNSDSAVVLPVMLALLVFFVVLYQVVKRAVRAGRRDD